MGREYIYYFAKKKFCGSTYLSCGIEKNIQIIFQYQIPSINEPYFNDIMLLLSAFNHDNVRIIRQNIRLFGLASYDKF